MKRVKLLAPALVLAAVAVMTVRMTAQETNTRERTIMTFSAAVEMPGVTLQRGTYVFKLADTPARNVVQVWDAREKHMIGHWLFVQAERPRVTEETVVMFKETREGATSSGTSPEKRSARSSSIRRTRRHGLRRAPERACATEPTSSAYSTFL
jgi:hypothetical protein